MRIPMPCKFGEPAECRGEILPLSGVSWFRWSWGMEYTYYFHLKDRWGGKTKMYSTLETGQPFWMEIPDSLLEDRPIKEHGYPLKGKGHACGLNYQDGDTYIDFIMTSDYWAHIRVQCDEKLAYVPDGRIIFPPSWDTEEKQEGAVLKACRPGLNKGKHVEKPKDGQLSVFDFISN